MISILELKPQDIKAQDVSQVVQKIIREYQAMLTQARQDLPAYYAPEHKDELLRRASPLGVLNQFLSRRLIPLAQGLAKRDGQVAQTQLLNFQNGIAQLQQALNSDPKYKAWLQGMQAKVSVV